MKKDRGTDGYGRIFIQYLKEFLDSWRNMLNIA
jgi:hypothetical protein